jgi:membrane fusion protein (multidrug efflux system)
MAQRGPFFVRARGARVDAAVVTFVASRFGGSLDGRVLEETRSEGRRKRHWPPSMRFSANRRRFADIIAELMPSAFARTLRSLELDSYRPAFVLGAFALPLLGGWIAWAGLSRAPVYAITTRARTEIEGSVIPVDVVEQGRVMVANLALGKHVAVGDLLLELDTSLEKARRDELVARREATLKRLEPLRKQKAALLSVLATQRQLGGATVEVASVRAESAKKEAERGKELADIAQKLAREGVGSKISEIETSLTANRRTEAAREGVAEVSRAAATQALEIQRLALQDIEFARALVDAEAELLNIDAQIHTTELQIERRTTRAIVAGYLGDVAPVAVGMTVSPGRSLATIIPDGNIRMVAYYPPTEAVGRVRVGQSSLLRFQAFPWTQFGVSQGTVTSVGVEPRSAEGRDGGVRVEIAIDRSTTERIPLQHGMPASVEVLVEHATPWQLLMRTMGGIATPSAEKPSSADKDSKSSTSEAP